MAAARPSVAAEATNLRVRTWRRLQQLGAIPMKQAVYVLPDSPSAREDFEWLKAEVKALAVKRRVFAANSVDAWSDDALVEEVQAIAPGGLRGTGRRRRDRC